jgi:hypothetical protein
MKRSLKNILPIDLDVQIKRIYGNVCCLGIVPAHGERECDLTAGDIIFTYFKYRGQLIPFLEPTVVKEGSVYMLGTVVYTVGDRVPRAPEVETIVGLTFDNRLPVPIDIWYQGNLVAQVYGRGRLDYLGGGGSILYFNNQDFGFHVGDHIEFRISLPGYDSKPLIIVQLTNANCNGLRIGVIAPI